MIPLYFRESLPDGFFESEPHTAFEIFEGPTLIHLRGESDTTVFISTLLHGNEHTGYEALKSILQNQNRKKSLLILIGNVEAARFGLRQLESQHDYNRVWSGGDLPEQIWATQVLEKVKTFSPQYAIDIHNNSGRNPHYACINKLDSQFFALAEQFSPLTVFFSKPDSALSVAMKSICPSLTIECGLSNSHPGLGATTNFLNNCINIKSFQAAQSRYEYYQVVARIFIDPKYSFDFGNEDADISLNPEIDEFNFKELPTNTLLGRINKNGAELLVEDREHNHLESEFFDYSNQEIRTKKKMVPSMLTTNKTVIEQDCLGYIMDRVWHQT